MAWDPQHKARSRQRILRTAAQLFALHGYEKVSIDQVMQEAGMTRGAFYAHFKAKNELYAEAILEAASAAGGKRPQDPCSRDQMIARYLSKEHLEGERLHCPLAFLVSDIAQRDAQVRDTWTRVFRGLVNLVRRDDEQDEAGLKSALQRVALMVGGVAIARALNDDALAQKLLESCRDGAMPETSHR
jgi:TetR/AcrR family transcriptional repressor of nem operon